MMKKFVLCVLLFCLQFSVLSAKNFMKFGDVSKEELNMLSYELDPDADAVVLGDYGSVFIDDLGTTGNAYYTYHFRIKILDETAFNLANVSLNYVTSNYRDEIFKIKAHTINVDASGKKAISKVEQGDIYKEKISDVRSAKKFSFPNVKVGSIIEYTFERVTEGLFSLHPWSFQGDKPVVRSQYDAEIDYRFDYAIITRQYHPIKNLEKLGSLTHSWYSENIPALIEEDFVSNINDYSSRLDFQLRGISYLGRPAELYMESWGKVCDELWDHSDFGKRLKSSYKATNEHLKAQLENEPDKEKQLEIIYNEIIENFKLDPKHSFLASQSIKTTDKEKSGRYSDLAFLLIKMLKEAGIEAHPVLLSTRAHGEVEKVYPIVSQFNKTIVYAKIGDKDFFLDPSNSFRPYDVLSISNLNDEGLIIKEDGFEWLEITTESKIEHLCNANLFMDAEGTVSGEISVMDKSYAASNQRKEYFEEGHDNWEKDYLDDFSTVNIDSSKMENLNDLSKPLKRIMTFSTPDCADKINDFIYFKPMLTEAIEENPFKLKKRNYPIDFAIPRSYSFILNLEIPEGYVVEELPKPAKLLLGDKDASFTYQASSNGSKVQLMSRMKIREPFYEQDQYDGLKEFYNLIVEKHAEQIILKKQ